MKIGCLVVLGLLISTALQAQVDGIHLPSGLTAGNQGAPFIAGFPLSSDSGSSSLLKKPLDSERYNLYGNLRDDDRQCDPKSPLWLCASRGVMNNVVPWTFDRIVVNAGFARISPSSWKRNITKGPE